MLCSQGKEEEREREREMSLAGMSVQEHKCEPRRSDCAWRRSTAVRPCQQPLLSSFRGEEKREGKVHGADLSDCPPGSSELSPKEGRTEAQAEEGRRERLGVSHASRDEHR